MAPKAWTPPRGRVLVLAAHPDDETLGCGGVILLHRRQGDSVKVVFLTDGTAGDPHGHFPRKGYAAMRRAEARRAAAILGVGAVEFWGLPDGGLAAHPDLRPRLRDLLRKEKPDVLYRPLATDPHPDHAAAGAGLPLEAPRLDCAYELLSAPPPSEVADISGVFSRKMRAVAQYRSQLRYYDYRKGVTRLNAGRGLLIPGSRYAEGYRIAAR